MPDGNSQKNVASSITTVEGRQNLKKMQSVQCQAGQTVKIEHIMRDKNGDPVDFSDLTNCSVVARIRESLSFETAPKTEIVGTIVDDTLGRVDIQLTSAVVEMPGISKVEIAIIDSDDNFVFSNELYLIVNRSQWAKDVKNCGPLSIAEIRLHLRDSGPEDNLWLDVEEFDLSEIAACIERPILFWNESPPPINNVYNTANFPFRYNWLNATIACLYKLAAAHYRRVHLPYSAGGVQVDDKNKSQEYEAIGTQLWNDYRNWVVVKKVQFNCEAAIQSSGSIYDGWR